MVLNLQVKAVSERYDLVIGGTGFASTFFLSRFLARFPKARVLVLEWGQRHDYAWMIGSRAHTTVPSASLVTRSGKSNKQWLFVMAMGGGSNAWWGQTPRFIPEDFALKSTWNVGNDWPLSYDDLAPYYAQAESLIAVAGDSAMPYPMSTDYPQPAHRFSGFDLAMQMAYPKLWRPAPTARSSTGTKNRGKCLAAGHCGFCPVDAKFRVMNEMSALYELPNVTLITSAEVRMLDLVGGRSEGVVWRDQFGNDQVAKSDLTFLGLNAVFNSATLLRSGDAHPLLGKGLNEQMGVKIEADLAHTENFDGSTHITGLGYMLYAGEHRRRHAAALIEHQNAPPLLRIEKGKLRQRALLKIVYENLPDLRNSITLQNDRPQLHFEGHSSYALAAHALVPKKLEAILDHAVGLEGFKVGHIEATEGHICGGTPMGVSRENSVVDAGLKHHVYRNVLLGGSGVFPVSSPSNPSLTIAALSLRAASSL